MLQFDPIMIFTTSVMIVSSARYQKYYERAFAAGYARRPTKNGL